VLKELLELWTPERETLLEDRLHGHVCAVVTERVERQFVIERRNGSVRARIDVAIPELRLAFEADGLFFHSTDEQIAADQHRDRDLMKRGWLTARFREGVLDDGARVRADVRAIVERRRQDRRAA
jgi:very-short-patch-repair endonuclease